MSTCNGMCVTSVAMALCSLPTLFPGIISLITFPDHPTHTSQASLTMLCIPLCPTAAELAPLSAPRDALPRSRLTHQLTLTYSLTLVEGGTVTPRFPRLNRLVYDGILDGQMHVVTDANKKVLGWGDIYPEVGLGRGTGARREGVCDRGGGVCLRPYSPSEGCGVEEGCSLGRADGCRAAPRIILTTLPLKVVIPPNQPAAGNQARGGDIRHSRGAAAH